MLPMMKTRSYVPSFVNSFFNDDFLPNFYTEERNAHVPSVNVIENKDDFKIEVAAPGLKKDDFKVDVHNNILKISSEKEYKNEEDGEKFIKREFCYDSFSRTFKLSNSIDSEKIKASYTNGVLELTIPKKEEAKEKEPRKIKIF